jgi:hypothetical protein
MANPRIRPSESVTYRVTWEIEIDATSPEEAARQAKRIQVDPESIANFFMVVGLDTEASAWEILLEDYEVTSW